MSDDQELTRLLAAPDEELAPLVPATLVFAAGGTRRAAALAGIDSSSNEYAEWTRRRALECFAMLFRTGVQHVIAPIVTPGQLAEAGPYRERLLSWMCEGMAGTQAIAEYQELGWRVRLIGSSTLPPLKPVADALQAATSQLARPTLWWLVVPNEEAPLDELLAAAVRARTTDRRRLMQALYGEVIPPATMLLAFGKPVLSFSFLPPLLLGEVQSYWMQRPGYSLTEQEWRTVLHDYAYLRRTWSEDKTGRAEMAVSEREMWERAPLMGLGRRLGSFWYPNFPEQL